VPDWLLPADACPADVLEAAQRIVPPGGFEHMCDLDMAACLNRCQTGYATACYAAALRQQIIKGPAALAEALFLRACALGTRSGCTNRAADMLAAAPRDAEIAHCSFRTFEHTCADGDAWGCEMLGLAYANGVGVDQDPSQALEILPRACEDSESDEACLAARTVMEQVQAAHGP
jgi:TPR repeat protein